MTDADEVRPQRGGAEGPDAGEPITVRDLRTGVRLVRTGADTVVVLRRPQGPEVSRRIGRAVQSAACALRLQFGAWQRNHPWPWQSQRIEAFNVEAFQRAFRKLAMMTCTTACVVPTPSQAHCSACHITFSGTSLFDMHRTGPVDARRCYPPDAIMRGATATKIPTKNVRGVWRYDIPRNRIPKGAAEAAEKAENSEPGIPD